MAKGPRYRVAYRRKREGKTNYKHRLNLLKAGKPRLVVRKSDKHILVQIIEYHQDGDQIKVLAHSKELKEKFNWKFSLKNMPAAYLTGFLGGYKGKKENIKGVILDLGLRSPVKGSSIYAALRGVVDSGLEIPHSQEVFPDEKRVEGKHIAEYTHKDDILKNFKESKRLIEKEFLKEKEVKKRNG